MTSAGPEGPAAAEPPHAADLLRRVRLSARAVLDVGCGTGWLGAAYRRLNPRARLDGIERDPRTVGTAQQRLDRVWQADLNRDPAPFLKDAPPGGYDCIVYAAVLEYLTDPWAVLQAQLPSLAKDGVLLLDVPNLEHWRLAELLLRGGDPAATAAVTDLAGTRLLTAAELRAGLKHLGLQPVDIAPAATEPHESELFQRRLLPGLQRLGIDPAGYLRRAAPARHLWRVQRRPAAPMAVVSTMLNPVGGVSEVRVTEPMQALQSEPGLVGQIVPWDKPPALAADMPRIFILHRPLLLGDQSLGAVRPLLAAGWLVVCEFDDHPDHFADPQGAVLHNFRAVHAVQTSTEILAEVLRRDNPEVAVFANAVARLPNPVNHRDPAVQTLFFGGLNRAHDWPALLPGLNEAAARAGERLHFRIVDDHALFEALQTPHKEFFPRCDYETYQLLLAGCEISFMPLADTPFNRCKSDLKFIEAAAHRVTALASPVVYADSITDGVNGMIFRDSDDLQRRLLQLVAHPQRGQAMGNAARTIVAAERMLAYQTARRIAWYRSLWARRAELHEALLARVPELRPLPGG